MSTILFVNNAQTTLAAAISDSATTLSVAAGAGELFPVPGADEYFVIDLTAGAPSLVNEIMHCTARNGDVLTVVRAQEGTTARAWAAASIVSNFWTAGQAALIMGEASTAIERADEALAAVADLGDLITEAEAAIAAANTATDNADTATENADTATAAANTATAAVYTAGTGVLAQISDAGDEAVADVGAAGLAVTGVGGTIAVATTAAQAAITGDVQAAAFYAAQAQATVRTLTADIKSLAAGTYAIDYFGAFGWLSPALTQVIVKTNWGAITNTHYWVCNANIDVSPYATTNQLWRDQELATFARVGTVYLRLLNGRAIFVEMNGEANSVQFGVATGVGGSMSQSVVQTNTLVGLPNYNSNQTENVIWTFGIAGLDAYLKLNGVEVFRCKYIGMYQMHPGVIGIQSQNVYGFRNLVATQLTNVQTYSNLEHDILDVRDFGVNNLVGVGSISASSTTFAMAKNPGFQAGDRVIIPIGGEAGGGQRGTKGVGGVWPSLSYANLAAMLADTTQGAGRVAYLVDTGNTYQYVSSVWTQVTPYYPAKANPLGLRATVVSVSGNNLTLDTAATVTSTNAAIHFDNAGASLAPLYGDLNPNTLFAKLPVNITVRWPPGEFAFSNGTDLFSRPAWQIVGQGQGVTVLFSPQGVPSMSFRTTPGITGINGLAFRDITLLGNARLQGYGFDTVAVGQFSLPGGVAYPAGFDIQTATGATVTDCEAIDVWQKGVLFDHCNGCIAERVSVSFTEGLAQYIQWMLQAANSTNCQFLDCTLDSPILTGGFEAFQSTGTQFVNLTSTNCSGSSNSSGATIYRNCKVTTKYLSWFSNGTFANNNPLLNINHAADPSYPDLNLGAQILYCTFIQEGPIDEYGHNLIGINVNFGCPNVTIVGTYDGVTTAHPDITISPNYPTGGPAVPGGGPTVVGPAGSIGIISSGDNTIIRNVRVVGKSPLAGGEPIYAYGNISVSSNNSSVTNCVADLITVTGTGSTQSGNRTNLQYGVGP